MQHQDFLGLPLEERRQIMARQAAELIEHYEQTKEDREIWQVGDFVEY